MKKIILYCIIIITVLLLILNYTLRHNRRFKIRKVEIEKFSIIKFDSVTNCMQLMKWDTSVNEQNTIIAIRFSYTFNDPSFFNLNTLGKHKQEGSGGSVDSIVSLKIVTPTGEDIVPYLSYNPNSEYFNSKDSELIKLPHTSGGWNHCFKARKAKTIEEIIKEYNNTKSFESNFSDYSLFQLNKKILANSDLDGLKVLISTIEKSK